MDRFTHAVELLKTIASLASEGKELQAQEKVAEFEKELLQYTKAMQLDTLEMNRAESEANEHFARYAPGLAEYHQKLERGFAGELSNIVQMVDQSIPQDTDTERTKYLYHHQLLALLSDNIHKMKVRNYE
ncbi:MAG: hypothetical protein QM703_18385 [Gemmatales bacterium]